MSVASSMEQLDERNWQRLMPLAELEPLSAKMVRVHGRQIAIFNTAEGIRVADNRCPHEGYPLSEGSLSGGCILTCNWHNWKFDLDSGDNLYGGDRLRTYPIEVRDGDIWADLTELPLAERLATLRSSLRDAFDDYSYDRMAREIARWLRLDGDPLELLRLSIDWSWQRLEFGWTHAYAGMADWLSLYRQHRGNRELGLVCLVEGISHVSYDVLRETEYPYSDRVESFDEARFLAAIESEDEAGATAMIRGGIRDGLGFADFEGALSQAALAHYNDFGHALIYVNKAGELIGQLGDRVAEPLLLSLVRELVFASREDQIPEFRGYARQLSRWPKRGSKRPDAALWHRQGINKSLQAVIACGDSAPLELYRALLVANAVNLLSFDIAQQDKVRVPVSGNVNWLDFTHGITFANAVRLQCERFPELWPQGLLQMACFNGRNATFTGEVPDVERWCSRNYRAQLDDLIDGVMDHGINEHIVSVHLLKTALAVRAEIDHLPESDARLLVAALTRFFESPLKLRQARRTAHQSLKFVARE